MFTFLKTNQNLKSKVVYESVTDGLKDLYTKKLLPLEKAYNFHEYHSPAMTDADFSSQPMIMLIGQYSTGKTTFIRYLLEQDYPGIRIGPEPTTDQFVVIMHSDRETIIPGNALAVDKTKPFGGLSKFGNNLLNRLQCSCLPNPVLQNLTIVDTPGILSGEKQRLDRGYDFTGVVEWFAERVDRIVLLFDAHKLDISDEFRRAIVVVKDYQDKIRIALNKADMVDSQQLMRVYGALMWSLGKVLHTPEVARVYIGSFWHQPLNYDANRRLFELETRDLFQDLQSLPLNVALRKLNDLIRRVRLAKVHAFLISHLHDQMPAMFGKDSKKKELINSLGKIYQQLSSQYRVSVCDFPKEDKMKAILETQDFRTFPSLKPRLLEVVDVMLTTDIARLMEMIPQEQQATLQKDLTGGAFAVETESNPFTFGASEGINEGRHSNEWPVNRKMDTYVETFTSLGPQDGKLSGGAVRNHFLKSKLPMSTLSRVWKLTDIDQDGCLNSDEFALACYLIELKLEGIELPSTLPDHLIPPSMRES